ncbi:hypothetical protein L3X38_031381 [Prunus dulcis]|uniref:Vacuolar fusion protein MON1 homolog n=1 Tax=Prunus dulcis TaxID=3755 RepID=A0AAD4VDH7_PRUDU|nr:hypothetical protein L3X38_031381 [Prunus dulcis]
MSSESRASSSGDEASEPYPNPIPKPPRINWPPSHWPRGYQEKRHVDEDDASLSWRKRKKHFFILSNSGKPIYSRHGDEHKLAGFSATLQAIISFVENGGDHVKLVRAGKHQVVFLVKGPIYLVCISCTEEPYESLRMQLELIYGQMLLILTKSVIRCFEKNPKFDMTPLLGGTDIVFSSLIHSFSWNPATFLHAVFCLAILMCKHKVISLNHLGHLNLSLQFACLDTYPMAFLYAYVHYLDADTYLMLLTTSSDAFYHLKDCRIRIEMVLLKSSVLSEIQRSMIDGGMRVEELPLDPLPLYFGSVRVFWSSHHQISSPRQQKRLYRAYQKLYASCMTEEMGPTKPSFEEMKTTFYYVGSPQDFELYAAFDPLADKALAIKTCNRVCQWVKDVENEIFLLGASPFSW